MSDIYSAINKQQQFIGKVNISGMTEALKTYKQMKLPIINTSGIAEALKTYKQMQLPIINTSGIAEALKTYKQMQLPIINTSGIAEALKTDKQMQLPIINTSGIAEALKTYRKMQLPINTSGITEALKTYKQMQATINTSGIAEVLKTYREIQGIINKSNTAESINEFNKALKEMGDAIKEVEALTLNEIKNQISNSSDLYKIFADEEDINIFECKDVKENNISKIETEELEKDIREVVEITFDELQNGINIQEKFYKKYTKWAKKNPYIAGLFNAIIFLIIEKIAIFLWSVLVVNVKTLVPLIIHEENKSNTKIVCTIPADTNVKLYPYNIPYYYYIIYTDPVTGEVYDGYVYKGRTKFEEIKAIDEEVLPASLY